MPPNQVIFNASSIQISEAQPNDIYLSVTMRMFSTRPNRNGCAVTEAFIDQIAEHPGKYLCIPLCADTKKLRSGDHKRLGHMLDQRTGMFLTEQIGAFASFEKVEDEYGVSLIGEARIAKRNKKVCGAIMELYDAGNLNFSFEILAGDVQEKDGVTLIDASDQNELIGMAVVSLPAYPEAKALALVAEIETDNREREMLAHTSLELAEADFETIRCWFFTALREALGDAIWDYRIERFGVDFAILYSVTLGRTLKVEFLAGDDGLALTDVYEVVFQRKDDITQPSPYQPNEGDVNLMSEAENKDLAQRLAAAQYENESLKDQIGDLKGELAGKDRLLSEQDEAVKQAALEKETLQAELDTLRAEKAEAEQEIKRQDMRRFAEAHGLDIESAPVATSIQNVDYAALMAESIAKAKQPAKPQMATYAMAAAGIQTEAYGGLLGRG